MKADALNWVTAIQSGGAAARRSTAEAGGSTFTLSDPEPAREAATAARRTLRDRDDSAARAGRADAKRDEAAASRSAGQDSAASWRPEDSASSPPVKRDTATESDASPARDAPRSPPAETARDPGPAARTTDTDKAKSAADAEATGTAVAQQEAAGDAVASQEADLDEADDAETEAEGDACAATADAASATLAPDGTAPTQGSPPTGPGMPPPVPSAQVQGQVQAQAQAAAGTPNGVPGQAGTPAVAVVAGGAGRSTGIGEKAASPVSGGIAGKAGEATELAHAAETASGANPATTSDAAVQGGALPPSFADHLGRTTAAAAAPATTSSVPTSPPTPLASVPVEIGMRALAGTNRFDIRLDPIELGRIDVRLEIDKEKGAVKAHLTVDRPETLALLQRDTTQLGQALTQAGLTPGEGDINVSLRDTAQDGARSGGQSGAGGDQPSRSGRGGASEADPVPQAVAWRGYAGTSGIDIRI